ncbi:DsbA family protein [uncultured Brevundimonas sp.]|uniref:DsbA family protein n=1 Tax=uncultured Brevundimonas sp. TaxID=213418 RepID=UPI0030EF5471|tara:strand:- start:43 stop:690 length:648 start_codon:yes stop_codon:yes gene_type:complete
MRDKITGKFRYGTMSRRAAMTAAALTAMATLAGCSGSSGGAAEGDMALGAPEGAKVTVVEYASVTCSHCAAWQEQVWPEFKTRYVDTDKIRYVFREFPTPPADIAAAGFLIARCAGDDKYFDVIHEIMASQREWRAGVPPRATLVRVATGAGLSEQQFQACVSDEAAIKALDARVKAGVDAGVNSTPTFLVNGTRVVDSSLESLSAAIDAELAKG